MNREESRNRENKKQGSKEQRSKEANIPKSMDTRKQTFGLEDYLRTQSSKYGSFIHMRYPLSNSYVFMVHAGMDRGKSGNCVELNAR